MNETFCPIPWIFQAVRNNGDIRICCQANVTKNQGVVRHADGTSYNAGRDDLVEARNADLMKTVRKNMLNGVWSEECNRCQQEEQSKLISRRNYENDAWGSKYNLEWAKTVTSWDGSIDPVQIPVIYYDLRFGNLCNLACRMCGPTDSHTWFKDYVDLTGKTEYKDTHGQVQLIQNENGRWITSNHDYDWHDSQIFWDYIEKNLGNIEYVYMAGGEPLMIERHYSFLEKCISSGYAKKIKLEYNTNMTNIQPKILEMWKHFENVRIGASVDGFGKVLEYQRYPAKWNQIERNLRKIDELPSNVNAWLAYTVTVYNVFHLPEFMLWKLEQNFKKINKSKKKPIVTHHVAHHPQHLNVRVLPAELKNKVKIYYEESKLKFQKYGDDISKNATSVLDSVSHYMMSADYSKHFDTFINDTINLDKLRGQSIVDVVPEFKELFNGK